MKTKLANFLSNIFSPYIVGPLTIFIACIKLTGVFSSLIITLATFITLIFPPLLYVLVQIKRGVIKDIHVKDKNARKPLYFLGVFCIAATFFAYKYLQAPVDLYKLLLAVFITFVICFVVNKFTKVSLHLASIAGSVTALYFIYRTPVLLIGIFFILLTAWARIYTKNHTLKQVVLGTLIASITTILVFLT